MGLGEQISINSNFLNKMIPDLPSIITSVAPMDGSMIVIPWTLKYSESFLSSIPLAM